MAAAKHELDEHQTNANALVAALREQRQMKMKGGLYHLNQVELAYNSNRIEGGQLTPDQTRSIFETKTISGDVVRLNDIVEMANHFRAFDAVIDNFGETIAAKTIKDYHRILKSGTSDAEKPWFVVGGWKSIPNEVGGLTTTAPEHVGLAIDDLLSNTSPRGKMTFDEIVHFHQRFESIHPFQDGNGRVGRLLLFQHCMQNDIMPLIVLDTQKEFYYRGLKQYNDEPGYLQETFRSFQDAYAERFAQFVPPAAAPPAGKKLSPDALAMRKKKLPRLFDEDDNANPSDENVLEL